MRASLALLIALIAPYLCSAITKLKLRELERTVDFGSNAGGAAHPCYRACDGRPMTCSYNMTLSLFSTLSLHCGDCPRKQADCSKPGCITAGGTSRAVYVANLMMPGPSIQVCEGDTVVVRVENAYANEGVTLHWHGQWVRGAPHMDGSPYVSQCPIMPNNVFEYAFKAYPAGTHMWHAHTGLLEADGLFGSLVVRRPVEQHASLYDEDLAEHVLALWHWYPMPNEAYLPVHLFQAHRIAGSGLLINGKGVMEAIGDRDAPCEELRVRKGRRYRLRMLYNSPGYCPVQVSVDNHTLTAVASDGADFKPVEVDSLMLNSGERWDVVLHANQAVGKYWLRVRGLGDCGPKQTSVFQRAIVAYEGSDDAEPSAPAPDYNSSYRPGKLLNPMQVVSADYSANELVRVSDLENVEVSIHGNISGKPDHIFYVALNYQHYDELATPVPYPQNNNVSFEYPAVPLILQRYEKTPSKSICTAETAHRHCIGNYCSCTLVEKIPLGALVEIVLVDLSIDRDEDHPYHIHGTNVHLVAEMTVGAHVSIDTAHEHNEQGVIPKRLSAAAPLKDTVTVPSQGFAVVRFRASNPGFWLFHCHASYHLSLGMGLVLQVGDESEMLPVPTNFPRCGDWVYSDDSPSSAAPTPTSATSPTLVLAVVHVLVLALTNV